MATNNIKIFDQNKANMLTDEAYNTSTQRLNGVQQGIASSQLQNKTLYQVSLVAYAIGQMMQANGLNANDADVVSTFAGNLSSTIVQKILDKASTVEAKNFAVNNKFITPQTWKAAYDFMKADSDMVTSAVDDTHYITPKLLKEGANLFGGKVELEDGTITNWRTFSKEIVNKNQYPLEDISSIKQVLIDKSKRYIIILSSKSEYINENNEIILLDYNTNNVLDSVKYSIVYNEKKIYFYPNISGLSENMFLLNCAETISNNTRPVILAINFSSGKFIVKNLYNTSLYNDTIYYLSNFEKNHFFQNELYAIVTAYTFSSDYAVALVKYDISSNTFEEKSLGGINFRCRYSFLDNDNNFCFILSEASGTSELYFYSSKDNFTVHVMSISFEASNDCFFQYKNSYLYILVQNSSKYGILYKYNIETNVSATQLFYSRSLLGSSRYGNNKMIVNDEEDKCFVGRTTNVTDGFYGPGNNFELNLNILVPKAIKRCISNDFEVMLGNYALDSVYVVKHKENDNISFLNNNFVFDLVYAYFGAPVTEIPEST